ncbi:type II toxin-antitoxin system ParD family antitoxin [Rhizobium tumorigenes]|uniref:Type II toxin-antitoxin system ParD family antitoxin n=1 Tax=Rhizobium tumorigenes TaxID=2041385 RepID=A0AAF1KB32_9HYPH|nr:type II toxin-antitoxin system ParD family antitoxin [Rhizobium tumorigenes]WFR96347.1 type II toxin-antitoxin system ParD family antitoxin [Rhizobium tumorigenes]
MATIRLDSREQAFVDEQVETGAYQDADAVLREALALLRKRDEKVARLRGLIQEGIDDIENGRVYEYETAEEFLKDIQQMAASQQSTPETDH